MRVPFDKIELPEHFYTNDDMLIFPPEDSSSVEILRGPNIGNPPVSKPIGDMLEGTATLKVGDKITTDHIMPAGARLKYRSNIPAYSEFVFENVDSTFSSRAAALRDEGKAVFVIAGSSYGQGSSREHAVICPEYLGLKAVVAKSIERIHQANLCNFGILPLLFENEEDYDIIDQDDELVIDDVHESIEKGEFTLFDKTKNKKIKLNLFASEEQKKMLIKGGKLNLLRD